MSVPWSENMVREQEMCKFWQWLWQHVSRRYSSMNHMTCLPCCVPHLHVRRKIYIEQADLAIIVQDLMFPWWWLKIGVLWDVVACSLVDHYRHFRGIYPEEGGGIFLWDTDKSLPDYVKLHPRKYYFMVKILSCIRFLGICHLCPRCSKTWSKLRGWFVCPRESALSGLEVGNERC